MASALLVGDAGAALSGAAQLYRDGFAARTVVEGLVAAFGAALHAELGLGGEGRLEGAEVPRLLKLQAALDEQESRFARSADQQSLELALTHALLAADGGGSSSVGASASVPADLMQRLNRLEKELSALRSAPGAARPAAAAPTTPERRPAAAVREEVGGAASAAAPVAAPRGDWSSVISRSSMQMRAFLKPARQHAEAGYVSLTYDERSSFHAKQIAGKFDELAATVEQVFGPVTFELIAPDGLGRRREATGHTSAPPPVAPTPIPAVTPAPAPPVDDLPDFDPTPRRAPRREAAPAPTPAPEGHSGAVRPPPRPPVNRAAPRETRLSDPPSPDDAAPAPLPEVEVPGWEEDPVAAPAPAPADAQGGDRVTPPTAARELYLGEIITEEPNWEDFGAPMDEAGLPALDDAPFAEYSAPRPVPRPAPRPAPAPTTPAETAPSRPGDIRAHPMFEDVKGRFPGRVREIGKNRRPQVARTGAAEEGGEDTPEDAAEA